MSKMQGTRSNAHSTVEMRVSRVRSEYTTRAISEQAEMFEDKIDLRCPIGTLLGFDRTNKCFAKLWCSKQAYVQAQAFVNLSDIIFSP